MTSVVQITGISLFIPQRANTLPSVCLSPRLERLLTIDQLYDTDNFVSNYINKQSFIRMIETNNKIFDGNKLYCA